MNKTKNIFSKGFTLIELLVVIAVVGVLAAGVIAAIDPVDKLRAANDAKVQSDMGALARASEAYAASHLGSYPPTIAELVTSGELRVAPTNPYAPTATYTLTQYPATCNTTTTPCTRIVIWSLIFSKKYVAAVGANPVQVFDSISAKSCQIPLATLATALAATPFGTTCP